MTTYLGNTVMRQYGSSATLLRLLADFDDWCDLAQFKADMLANVWNIDTAVGFGLDIWGRILGQSRQILVTAAIGENFGFYTSPTQSWQPWSQAPWWQPLPEKVLVTLNDTAFRKLLLVKAAANLARCDASSLNALARAMFGDRGDCFVLYGADPMTMEYHFRFTPTSTELAIIESGLFPVPAGVKATIVTY